MNSTQPQPFREILIELLTEIVTEEEKSLFRLIERSLKKFDILQKIEPNYLEIMFFFIFLSSFILILF